MNTYPVYLMDLPTTIAGFCRKMSDGYCVVINARLSSEAQRRAYLHEVDHIERGDLESDEDADSIERKAEK